MNLKSPGCEEVIRNDDGRMLVDVEEMANAAIGQGFEAQYVQKVNHIVPDPADAFNLLGPRVTGRMYLPAGVYYTRGLRDGHQVSFLFYLSERAEVTRLGEVVRKHE